MAQPTDGGAAAAPGRLDFYPVQRMQRLGSMVVLQPVWHNEVAGPSLSVDLQTGSAALAPDHPAVLRDYTLTFGVLGLARLPAGPALVVITGVEEVRSRSIETSREGKSGRGRSGKGRSGRGRSGRRGVGRRSWQAEPACLAR